MSQLRKQVRHLSFSEERFQVEVAENFRDVDANLRSIPEVEFKTVDFPEAFGSDPVRISTIVTTPISVTIAQALSVGDPEGIVMPVLYWRRVPETEPGVVLLDVWFVDANFVGDPYTVTLRIEGMVG